MVELSHFLVSLEEMLSRASSRAGLVSKARPTLHFPGKDPRIIIRKVGGDVQDDKIHPLAKYHHAHFAMLWLVLS